MANRGWPGPEEDTSFMEPVEKNEMTVQSRMWTLENWCRNKFIKIEGDIKDLQVKTISVSQKISPLLEHAASNEPGKDIKFDQNETGSNSSETAKFPAPNTPLPMHEKAKWSFSKAFGKSDKDMTKENTTFIPSYVRQMPAISSLPLQLQPLPLEKATTFPGGFLTSFLGGTEYSAGLYYPATGIATSSKQLATMLKSETYYLLDESTQPFAPKQPGAHGAKIAPLLRPLEDDKMAMKVPLFMCFDDPTTPNKKYAYLGHYSQTRWPDRLDYDRAMELIPSSIISYWTSILSSKTQRPDWMVEQLMITLCPRPDYDGPIATDDFADATSEGPNERSSDTEMVMQEELRSYMQELRIWKNEAEVVVEKLNEDGVLNAFERADASGAPGLRFWWEYLECVGFDRNFYYLLDSALKEWTE